MKLLWDKTWMDVVILLSDTISIIYIRQDKSQFSVTEKSNS